MKKLKTNPLDIYIQEQWSKLDSYVEGVKSGAIISNVWVKKAVARYERDLENDRFELRRDKVERVFKFFSLLKINVNNTYQQFQALPYQVFICVNMMGFYWRGTDKRRFRYSFLFQARKNGKTVFAAILNLYFLIADGVADPQSLLLGSTREQASIALEYSKSIVINSPALANRLTIMQYQIRYDCKQSRGFMKTLASQSHRLDGYNPSACILDEIHAYVDDALFKVMKSGALARQNPMIMLISTAGFKMDSFCNEMVETIKNILNGDVIDESFFGMLYCIDEDDDYQDPETWCKANPALGEIITMEALQIEYDQAVNTPSQMPNFLTKHLNVFTASTEAFIPDPTLKKCFKPVDYESLKGMDMYLGLDLSSTKDLTALVGIIQDPSTEMFHTFPFFFRADNLEKRFRRGGLDLTTWIDQGYITQCQTATIDYNIIVDKIAQLAQDFNIVMLAYDKFNSALIIPKINELGINSIVFGQTPLNFNFPLKYMEKLIYDEQINLSDNKCLLWNFRNIVLYMDGNGNIKIMKNKSRDAVDGCVSLAMAFGAWLEYNLNEEMLGLKIYNEAQNKT